MAQPTDVEENLQQLTREQAQLQFAFRELGTFLGAALTGRAMLDPESVIASFDQLASDARDKHAESCGEVAVPDPHLRFIADEVRKLCRVNFSVITAGKKGPDEGPDPG